MKLLTTALRKPLDWALQQVNMLHAQYYRKKSIANGTCDCNASNNRPVDSNNVELWPRCGTVSIAKKRCVMASLADVGGTRLTPRVMTR
jgi:hypothetical protein